MSGGFELSTIDLTIIVVYFAAVLFVGLRLAGSAQTGDDLFLAGRRLGWVPIGFSLFASNISSTTLIGLSGAAYVGGIYISNYEWMAAVVLVFFVIHFVPTYIRAGITTVPELLERRFDRRSRVYFSGLTILTNVVIDTAGSLFAGALVLQLFFPHLDLYTTCIVLAVVAGLYTAVGGLAAVVYTDVIQAVVLLVGACITTVLLFGELDYSWDRVVAETPPEMLSLIRPLDDPNLPWLGTLVGVPILGFYFWCTNQFIVQRVLGARSVHHAQWGSLLGGLLKLPVLFIMVLPGTMARIVFPDLETGDIVFPTLITELLPVGVVGLVLAGLIAAIMSSVDSTLNSAATLVTMDFVKPRRPDISDAQVARIGRISMGCFMIFAALWAPQIAHFEGLFQYLQLALSYIVPPVVTVFVLGLYWRRGTATASFATLLGGHAVSIATLLGQKLGLLPSWHFTLVAGALLAASVAIFVGVSYATAPPDPARIEPLMAKRVAPAPQWWADYRVLSGAILVLTAAMVIAFW